MFPNQNFKTHPSPDGGFFDLVGEDAHRKNFKPEKTCPQKHGENSNLNPIHQQLKFKGLSQSDIRTLQAPVPTPQHQAHPFSTCANMINQNADTKTCNFINDEEKKSNLGFIADDVKDAKIPKEWDNIIYHNEDNMKLLAYNKMTVVLWGAVKELMTEKDELVELVKSMKKEMTTMKGEITKLKGKGKGEGK